MPYKDPEKRREVKRKSEENAKKCPIRREKKRASRRAAQRSLVIRNKQLLEDIKAINVCQDCGGKFDPCVYEFHHEVKGNYQMSQVNLSTSTLLKELENCVILCANCHKMRHKFNKSAPVA